MIPSSSQQKDNNPDSTSVAKEEHQKELEEKLPSTTDKNLTLSLAMNTKDNNNLVDDQDLFYRRSIYS